MSSKRIEGLENNSFIVCKLSNLGLLKKIIINALDNPDYDFLRKKNKFLCSCESSYFYMLTGIS